jgi:hypothetical protein
MQSFATESDSYSITRNIAPEVPASRQWTNELINQPHSMSKSRFVWIASWQKSATPSPMTGSLSTAVSMHHN